MANDPINKNLGTVTAYGYAKSKGYTGTEEEFAELMADYAIVGEQAAASAQEAAASAQEAQDAKDEAEAAASSAQASGSAAASSASAAASAAQEAAGSASAASAAQQGAEAAQQAAEDAQGAAEQAATAAGTAKDAAQTAQQSAEDAKVVAVTAQGQAEQSASDAQDSAREAHSYAAAYYALLPTDEGSGPVASFPDGADGIPVKSMVLDIVPQQAGSGDPSPENVRPITGWTGVNVSRSGRNLFKFTAESKTESGITFTVNADGSVHVAGTATANVSLTSGVFPITALQKSDCLISGNPTGASASTYRMTLRFFDKDGRAVGTRYINTPTAQTIPADSRIAAMSLAINISDGVEVDATFAPMLTFPGDAGSTYEPYSGTNYTISWESEAGAVYGGMLDVTTGLLTVTAIKKKIKDMNFAYQTAAGVFRTTSSADYSNSLDGRCSCYATTTIAQPQNMPNNSICLLSNYWDANSRIVIKDSRYTTAADLKANMGEEEIVFYPSSSSYPITYQLSPTEVETMLGVNNIWADTGDSAVTYRAEVGLYIDKKLGVSG